MHEKNYLRVKYQQNDKMYMHGCSSVSNSFMKTVLKVCYANRMSPWVKYWLPTFNATQTLILNIVVCQLIWESWQVHFQEVVTETIYKFSMPNLNRKASHKMHYTHEHNTLTLKPHLISPYTQTINSATTQNVMDNF